LGFTVWETHLYIVSSCVSNEEAEQLVHH
jgi:hypothetical protein